MQGVGAASAEDGFIVRALPRPLASAQLQLRAAHPHPDKKLCAAHKARALVLSAVGGFAVRAERLRSDADFRSAAQ
jgi:hypothetical protein